MLDTARFTNFVAEKLDVPVGSVKTLTLRSHGDTMVPVPSACTVDGKPPTDLLSAEEIDELVTRTRNGGRGRRTAQDGSAYYAPLGRSGSDGQGRHRGLRRHHAGVCLGRRRVRHRRVFLGVQAEIGREGIRRIVETELTDTETAGLKEAAEAVRAKQADVKDL